MIHSIHTLHSNVKRFLLFFHSFLYPRNGLFFDRAKMASRWLLRHSQALEASRMAKLKLIRGNVQDSAKFGILAILGQKMCPLDGLEGHGKLTL